MLGGGTPTSTPKKSGFGLGGLSNLLDFGLGFLGIGQARSDQKWQRNAWWQQFEQSKYQFEQQMDHALRRRVEDAKRAGVHPLFAMGASVGASPTMQAGNPPTGSAVGDAIARLGEAMGTVGMNRAAARRDEAEAQYLDSLKKRIESDLNSRGRDGARTYAYGEKEAPALQFGPAEFFAPQVPSMSRKGVAAGQHPRDIDIMLPDGRTIQIYNPDLGLDEIGQVRYIVDRTKLWATDRIEDIATWIKDDSPSDADIKRMERYLKAMKENPEALQQWEQRFKTIGGKVGDYFRRFHNWSKSL